jgi:hypothetical protein
LDYKSKNFKEYRLITDLETIILSATQTIYDSWGWFGVAAFVVF